LIIYTSKIFYWVSYLQYRETSGIVMMKNEIFGPALIPVTSWLQNAEEDAGRIGLTMVLAGVVGSITGGVVLDKTHRFK
jgi:hypothetical protein